MFDRDQMVGAAAVSAGDHGMVVCWAGETSVEWPVEADNPPWSGVWPPAAGWSPVSWLDSGDGEHTVTTLTMVGHHIH